MAVSQNGEQFPGPLGLTAIVLVAVLTLGTWAATNRLPRIPRDKLGIVLALASDDDAHDRQVRVDFVRNLRSLLERDPDGANFALAVLPRHLSAEIETSAGADKYLRKLRGHFMLYGRVTKRRFRGQDVHVLNFDGLVRHARIPLRASQSLAGEFRSVIPQKVIVPTDADFFAFEATSQLTDIAARYIIGLAALLSGALAYSERLLLMVEQGIQSGFAAHPPLREVGQRLPEHLKVLYERWLGYLTDRFTMTGDVQYVQQADEVVQKLLRRDPRNVGAHLMQAICEFLLRGDIPAAKRATMKARMASDTTWRYNMAFLEAYEGNLDMAETWYEDAFKGRLLNVTVPVQCEGFIQSVLEKEPDKAQLHYCSGLINYSAKKDWVGAIRDFDAFLAHSESNRFPSQRQRAQELRDMAVTRRATGTSE